MSKIPAVFVSTDLVKAHVAGYTRKDGIVVKEHDDKRAAAGSKPTGASAPKAVTKNEGYGFHGEASREFLSRRHGADDYYGKSTEKDWKDAHSHADTKLHEAADHLVSAGHFENHQQAGDYLDSTHGRHLHDGASFHDGDVSKVPWLGRDVKAYKKKADMPMTKSLVLVTGDLAKAHVDSYTRKDGVVVQAHDDKRAAAQAKPMTGVNRRAVKNLKEYHKADAKWLKSSLASALSVGDTETEHGKPMTYGDVKSHMHTMRSQLGGDASHAQHLEHAQYALNQSMGGDSAPLSEKHAKLIGAALSGKTKMDEDGMVRHAAVSGGADKPTAGAPRASQKKFQVRDNAGNVHKVFHGENAEYEAGNHAREMNKKGGRYSVRNVTPVGEPAGSGGAAKPAAEFGVHHSKLKVGDHLYDKNGQKVDEVDGFSRGINSQRVHTRSGYTHGTRSDGFLPGLSNKKPSAPKAAKPTGSAAPAKMMNVGTEKWPQMAKTSEKLSSKNNDGFTHHVGGFKAPDRDEHRNLVRGSDHLIHHEGKLFGFTGKSGKNMKTGEDSFEYSAGDHQEHRAWVTRSGHLMND
jgi:hypothetical protein